MVERKITKPDMQAAVPAHEQPADREKPVPAPHPPTATQPMPHEHDAFVASTAPSQSFALIDPPPIRLLAEQMLAGGQYTYLDFFFAYPKAAYEILREQQSKAQLQLQGQPKDQATEDLLKNARAKDAALAQYANRLPSKRTSRSFLPMIPSSISELHENVNRLLTLAQLPTIEDLARSHFWPENFDFAKLEYFKNSPIFSDIQGVTPNNETYLDAMYEAALEAPSLPQSFDEVLGAADSHIASKIAPHFAFESYIYGGQATQNQFHLSSAYYVAKAAQNILAGKSGFSVLLYLASGRRQQAAELRHENNLWYGVLRATNWSTNVEQAIIRPGDANYVPYYDAYRKLADSSILGNQNPDEPLTYMQMIPHHDEDGKHIQVRHTLPNRIPELMKRFSDDFHNIQVKNYPETLEGNADLLRDLGSLHWLLAISMPFLRGSAAVGENLIRALLLAKGRKIENFRVMPDLEAFSKNRTEFSADYAGLFLTPPAVAHG